MGKLEDPHLKWGMLGVKVQSLYPSSCCLPTTPSSGNRNRGTGALFMPLPYTTTQILILKTSAYNPVLWKGLITFLNFSWSSTLPFLTERPGVPAHSPFKQPQLSCKHWPESVLPQFIAFMSSSHFPQTHGDWLLPDIALQFSFTTPEAKARWFSKCAPWDNSSNSSQELARSANSRALLKTSCMLKFEKLCNNLVIYTPTLVYSCKDEWPLLSLVLWIIKFSKIR